MALFLLVLLALIQAQLIWMLQGVAVRGCIPISRLSGALILERRRHCSLLKSSFRRINHNIIKNRMTAQDLSSNDDTGTTNPLWSSTTETSSKICMEWKAPATVHLYPLGSKIPDNDVYHSSKIIHFIRHGEGTHNVENNYRDPSNEDAKLTARGFQQCRDIASKISNNDILKEETTIAEDERTTFQLLQTKRPLLIVASPMTRCIQTALLTMDPILNESNNDNNSRENISIVVHESVRETVNFICDKRRSVTEIQNHIQEQFPSVDIDYTSYIETNHDEKWESYVRRIGCDKTWTRHRESGEIHVVAERGRQFFQWLFHQVEVDHVVVCTHSAFLRCLLNFGIDNEKGIPKLPPQLLVPDDHWANDLNNHIPVVQYCGKDSESFSFKMRQDYDQCEIRSMIVAFPLEK